MVISGRKRGSVEIIATMGGSPVMYNLSSLAKTKQETDDGHVSAVQVSGGAGASSGWLSQWVSRASGQRLFCELRFLDAGAATSKRVQV